jgi:hypothetical protein
MVYIRELLHDDYLILWNERAVFPCYQLIIIPVTWPLTLQGKQEQVFVQWCLFVVVVDLGICAFVKKNPSYVQVVLGSSIMTIRKCQEGVKLAAKPTCS